MQKQTEGPRVVSVRLGDNEPRLVTVEMRHYKVGGGTFDVSNVRHHEVGGGTFIVKSRSECDR